MSVFDDHFQRRIRIEESMRRALTTDDVTRRSLVGAFDVARQVREVPEHKALMTSAIRMREQLDRMQMDQVLTQYRFGFNPESQLRAIIENLRSVETLRNIDRITNLRHLAEGLAAPSRQIRDQIASAAAHYKNNFTLPDPAAIAKLREQALSAKDLHLSISHAMKAMEAMKSPWLDVRRALESVRGLAGIQSIGVGASNTPFDTTFTTILRKQLGDWRDVETFPSVILEDPIARSEFYVEQGFDPALADFPGEAFDEATEAAGLVLDEEDVDFSGHERLYHQLVRVEFELRRFVHRIMTEAFGDSWPDRVPDLAKRWRLTKQKRLNEAQPEQPLLISYSELSDLQEIMQRSDHFHLFKPKFRRVESMQETFRRILPARHAVAHCGVITQIDMITVLAESMRLRSVIRI
jgi:hypothetical protein